MTWSLVILATLVGFPAGGQTWQSSDSAGGIEIENAQVLLIHDQLVPARQAGVLREFNTRPGDQVIAGEDIGAIDLRGLRLDEASRRLELQIARLRSESDIDYRFAEKSFEVANARLRRAQNAYEQFARSVTQTEIDELGLTAKRAELQMEQSLMEQEAARLDVRLKGQQRQIAALRVEQGTIVAERDGIVVEVYREEGEWVREGDPVLRVVSLTELYVDGFVQATASDAALVGRSVTFVATDPVVQPPVDFNGRIIFASPLIDPVNAQIKVRAKIDNPDSLLRPGTIGRMTIH